MDMIDYAEALRMILAHAGPRGAESVPVDAAAGRVLAQDVPARISSPPFDKAAMDGYAVRARDVQALPAELEVDGQAFAGGPAGPAVGPGQACAITTGAPVPPGADTVVMVEHTEQLAEGRVCILRLTGANICPEGEDVRAGDVVLRAGQVMTPLRTGLAATAGWERLEVARLPSAALLCTGTEVVEPGEEPGPGRIYNANGPMLTSLLAPLCREVTYLGIVADDEAQLEAAVRRGLASDLLLVSGGVSMGRLDLVPAVLERCGVRQGFHRVAVKPGKPVFFGTGGRCLVLGMPGNPMSCYVIFRLLAEPALAAMAGRTELPPTFEEGAAAEAFANQGERMNVLPCRVERCAGGPLLRLLPHHGSADLAGPSAADGFLIVPRGVERVTAGDRLRFFMA
jgi:molybdopterin molybdotransferase